MIWLIRRVQRDFSGWDRATQIAFVLAIVLLVVGLFLIALSPQEARLNVVIGVGALLILAQAIILWGNRGMVTPYTQAQRLYLNGNLEGARTLLERAKAAGTLDMRATTLLGVTYRQLGRLDESAAILYEAVHNAPVQHFPLYNYGRTLLAQGHYANAATAIERSLELGSPSVTRFDVAEALMLQNDQTRAADLLIDVQPDLIEPHRKLMAAWWLHRIGQGDPPDAALIDAGLPFWSASAQRFAGSPYGQAIGAEVSGIERLRTSSV